MTWAKEKARLERANATPEQVAAAKAKRAADNREYRERRRIREGRPARKTDNRDPEERAEYKRNARTQKRDQEINEFLAGGAPTNGFSAFLRSAELRIAEALPPREVSH